ncbi:MAG: DUF3467 domain-containing protein [Desulfatitalea sp.]|nr:DUF3467 domain-containing protein [Desulfatitalea sp.]NNK02437.1 DUF3467 domain-containing protein [Desulfatitalea sp.]
MENKLEGKYANCFKIGYNAYEFIVDFGQCYAGQQEDFSTRIVTSPVYAKTLLKTLQNAIAEYEKIYDAVE